MFGPIIVSAVGVSLPVVAGILLAPRRASDRSTWMQMRERIGFLRSLITAVQSKNRLRQLPAGLESSSSFRAG
jgi:hypothetical protein